MTSHEEDFNSQLKVYRNFELGVRPLQTCRFIKREMPSISCVFTLSAFSREFLMDSRWLLDGLPKTAGLCAHWHSILKMCPSKQAMFLERLFHLHDVQQRRAGRACVTRLSQEQWLAEIDSICLQSYIYDSMIVSKDSRDNALFDLDTLKKVKLGIMEGNLVIALDFFRLTWTFVSFSGP